jgi:hypothetical protein
MNQKDRLPFPTPTEVALRGPMAGCDPRSPSVLYRTGVADGGLSNEGAGVLVNLNAGVEA